MLQINLTVLATAHAVSESIVRGVNAEMQQPQYSQHLYRGRTARGAGTAPHDAARGQPLAVTRRAALRSERVSAALRRESAPGNTNIFHQFARPFQHGVQRVL